MLRWLRLQPDFHKSKGSRCLNPTLCIISRKPTMKSQSCTQEGKSQSSKANHLIQTPRISFGFLRDWPNPGSEPHHVCGRRYGGFITNQLRRLGASCDWSRERFTLDQGLSSECQTSACRWLGQLQNTSHGQEHAFLIWVRGPAVRMMVWRLLTGPVLMSPCGNQQAGRGRQTEGERVAHVWLVHCHETVTSMCRMANPTTLPALHNQFTSK